MASRFSVEAVFNAIDRISAPVSRMQNRVGKFTRRMQRGLRSVNRQVDKLGRGLKKAAAIGATSAILFGAVAANVVAAGADFEQAIVNVGAVSLRTRDQIKPLEKLALQLGRTTKFTATQSANAMEVMARAGFKTNEILTATPAVLAAAAASGLEIAEVANVVSNALKGMGLATSEAARVADVLALASAKTNSTIGSLGESLKNVASTARQLNVPIEDTVAAIALLQDVGLDASVAGSAFNTMLTKMAAPTKGMQKKMKDFGISFKDAKGDMLPLEKVLQQLNVASKKAGGNFDKVAFLAELVGLRGQKAASNLGTLFETGRLTKLTDELKNASGVAKKMAAIRMDTLAGQMTLLNSVTEGLKITLTELKSGAMKEMVTAFTVWASKIDTALNASKALSTQLIDGLLRAGKGVLGVFGLLVTQFVIMKTAMIAIGVATKAWTAATIAFNLAMGLTRGLLLTSLAVTNTSKAAYLAWGVGLKIATAAQWLFNAAMAATTTLPLILAMGLLIGLGAIIVKNWDKIKSTILGAIGSIKGALSTIVSPFKDLFGGVSALRSAVRGLFGGDEEKRAERAAGDAPEVVTPQDRTARSIEERRETSTAEVTIKDETGRAEMKQKGRATGVGLTLAQSGAP